MEAFIKKHFSFILTIFVTYGVSIFLIWAQYDAAVKNSSPDDTVVLLELLLNSLIPTTITYVFGCVLVNIVEIMQDDNKDCFINVFTCILVFMYAILFCIYTSNGFSQCWVYIEFFATASLLILNVFCYKEKFKHRNHGLV